MSESPMVRFCGVCGQAEDSPFLTRWCAHEESNGTMSLNRHLWNWLFAIRNKDAPELYLSDQASLDDLDSQLTFNSDRIAFYGSPETARAAWKMFFKMEEGEVVRWSPDALEVVA